MSVIIAGVKDQAKLKPPKGPLMLTFHHPNRNTDVLSRLATMQKARTFCNIAIRVEKREFHAHKNILAASSDFFLDLFMANLSMSTFVLDNISCEAFEALFQYMYTSKLDVPAALAPSLLKLALRLRMTEVEQACAQFLTTHLTLANIVEVRESVGGDKHEMLCAAADAFIRDHSEQMIAAPDRIKFKLGVLVESVPDYFDFRFRLAELIVDWLDCALVETNASLSSLSEQRLLLYLTPGNALIDCGELVAANLTNLNIIRDYICAAQAGKQMRIKSRPRNRSSSNLNDSGVWNGGGSGNSPRLTPTSSSVTNGSSEDSPQTQTPSRRLTFSDTATRPDTETCVLTLSRSDTNVNNSGSGNNFHFVAKLQGHLICLSVQVLPLSDLGHQEGAAAATAGAANQSQLGHSPLLSGVTAQRTHRLSCGSDQESESGLANGANGSANGNRGALHSGSDDSEDALASDSPKVCRSPLIISHRTNSLEPLAKLATPRCAAGVVAYKDEILVIGGYNRGECLDGVERYSVELNNWRSGPKMTTCRGRLVALHYAGDTVFATGGSTGSRETSSVEKLLLSPEDGNEGKSGGARWSRVRSMVMPRSSHGGAVINDRLCVVGGCNGADSLRAAEMYDPATDIWATMEPLLSARNQAAVCTMEGRLYVVGGCCGWTCLASGEVYDPGEGRWRPLPDLPHPRRGAALVPLNGRLYVIGGSDGQTSLASTEVYDPIASQWAPGPALNLSRANTGACVVGGRIFVTGGFNGRHFLNNLEHLDAGANEWCLYRPVLLETPY